MNNPSPLLDLIRTTLDRQFAKATSQVMRAIAGASLHGLMAQRLRQLEEAAQQAVAGETGLPADDPAVRALIADFETTMRRNASLVDAASGETQWAGILAAITLTKMLALPTTNAQALRLAGITWRSAGKETLGRIIQYTSSDAWKAELLKYGVTAPQRVQMLAIQGAITGRDPLAVAQDIRTVVEGMPTTQATQMLRSLQMTSYRDAQVAEQLANADILAYAIRVETLDGGTCLACWALHGTLMELGQRIDEHRNGRAIAVPVFKGQNRTITTGPARFAELQPDQKAALLGPSAWEAYQAGKVDLRDFVHHHQDPVFGSAITEASLTGLLGPAAAQRFRQQANS